MGFRDFHSFDFAMLGKQVWRIIHYPNSLLSRVFKAKYFSDNDVLEAKAKNNSSYTWKSIFGALHLVTNGIRWRVGNGGSSDIWAS